MCDRSELAAHHRERTLIMRPDFRLSVFRRACPIRSEASRERFIDTFRRAGFED
jgi:hypothetical protein